MASFLDTLFGGGAEQEAAQKDIAAANQYGTTANTALGQGYTTGSQAINSAVGAYAPLANLGSTYSAAAPTYMAALGVGTPDAVKAAQTGFTSTPGYQAMLDSASQAVQRQQAAGGMGASGNANIDAILASSGITSQQYQQYIQNLQNAGQMGVQATGAAAQGQAAGYGSLANLATQYGEDQSGIAGNVASTTVGANNLAAAGEAAGAKNLLGAGLSLATLGLGGNPFGGSLTGGGGASGGSLLSSLGTGIKNLNLGQSMFGGGSPTGL
jgi:hypothetical protein